MTGYGQAVCSGGRYDGLMASYGRPAPATGFTFDLLNLLFALDARLDKQVQPQTDYLVFAEKGGVERAQELTRRLREAGFSAARDMVSRPQQDALAYARLMNYRQLLIVAAGDAELQLVSPVDGRTSATTIEKLLQDTAS